MDKVVIKVLPVAQGSMNLIEGYKGDDLKTLVMIDFGGTQSSDVISPISIRESINYALKKMKQRAQQPGSSTKLDYLLITHRDEDHYNFIKRLFSKNYSASVEDKIVTCSLAYDDHYDTYYADKEAVKVSASRSTNVEDDGSLHISYNEFENYRELNCVCGKYHLSINSHSSGNASLEVRISEHFKPVNITSCRIKGNLVLINDKQILLDENNKNPYEEFVDWTTKIIDEYICYKKKDELINTIKEKSRGLYKTVDEVEYLAENTPPELFKPIDKCFIGGETYKNDDEMNFIRKLSKEVVEDWSSQNSICEFDNSSVQFKIVGYYSEKTLMDLFETDSDIYSQSNATSAIGMLIDTNYTDFKFVFPGDATCHTFYAMTLDGSFDLLKKAGWTAPHHGSFITLDSKDPDIFNMLLNEADVKKMVVSAGYNNSYGLPNKSFIRQFNSMLMEKEVKFDEHELCFNDNDGSAHCWCHISTTAPLYTTLVCDNSQIGYAAYSLTYDTYEHEATMDIDKGPVIENTLYAPFTAPSSPNKTTLSKLLFIKR